MNQEEKQVFFKENKQQIEQKLSNARTKIMVDSQTVFMSNIILTAPMEVSFDLDIPTMGTNGLKILYDPEFVFGLDYKELIFVIVHEGMHNLFLHTDTTRHKMVVDNNDEFNQMIFNISGDIIINSFLTVHKIGKCPKGAVESNSNGNVEIEINGMKFTFKEAYKLTLDEIYREIISKVPRQPKGSGKGNGNEYKKGQMPTGDDCIGGERLEVKQNGKLKAALDKINKATEEEVKEIENAIRQQWVKNKQQGIGSQWLNEKMDEMLKPIVNWKNELRAFISPEITEYESYHRRNRRLVCYEKSHGLIFPGEVKNGATVIVNFDTSGSISQTEMNYFLGELHHMFKSFPKGALKVKIMLSTDEVYYFEDLPNFLDAKNLKIKSGGTCHLEVFEKANKDKINALICFTDNETRYPEQRPRKVKKALIISTTKKKAPKHIGRTINVDLNKLMGL